ncbi:MAG: hypothetical protein IJH37_11395 [Clostridia bacterium]|nr:hypothetical protein [Clostridia bacterium]
MMGSVTIADSVITDAVRHIVLNIEGVVALTDKAGRWRRGRVAITRDRKLVIYLLCRYGANTNCIYNKAADEIRRFFGDTGNIHGIVMYVVGIGD